MNHIPPAMTALERWDAVNPTKSSRTGDPCHGKCSEVRHEGDVVSQMAGAREGSSTPVEQLFGAGLS